MLFVRSVGHGQPPELCPLLGLHPAMLCSLQGARDWNYSRPQARCTGSNLGTSRDDLLSPTRIHSQHEGFQLISTTYFRVCPYQIQMSINLCKI